MSKTRATMHGIWVGATGDLTRLRKLRAEAETSSTVRQAWQNTGAVIRNAAEKVTNTNLR